MAKKTRRKSTYHIQCGRLRHQVLARNFKLWLAAGLIALVDAKNQHVAQATDRASTMWEASAQGDGVLHVVPTDPPGVSLRTNAQVVDQQYIYADGGQIRVSSHDRQRFTDWRTRFGLDTAETMIAEFLNRKREFDMREQYGWGI